MYLMEYAKKHYHDVHALIVNHQLRPESSQEALQVGKWCAELGVPYTILVWHHDPVSKRIQESARFARYDLLIQWCKENQCRKLLVGHHLRDQFETFLMRLSKGSGLKGLCSMKHTSMIDGIEIIRPFLDQWPLPKPERYITDPSNNNPHYERVRYRQNIAHLENAGFSLSGFQKSIEKLQKIEDFLCQQEARFLENHVSLDYCEICYEPFKALHEVVFERVVNRILRPKEGDIRQYPIKSSSVNNFYQAIQSETWRGSTLGGYKLQRKKDKIVVCKEAR